METGRGCGDDAGQGKAVDSTDDPTFEHIYSRRMRQTGKPRYQHRKLKPQNP